MRPNILRNLVSNYAKRNEKQRDIDHFVSSLNPLDDDSPCRRHHARDGFGRSRKLGCGADFGSLALRNVDAHQTTGRIHHHPFRVALRIRFADHSHDRGRACGRQNCLFSRYLFLRLDAHRTGRHRGLFRRSLNM